MKNIIIIILSIISTIVIYYSVIAVYYLVKNGNEMQEKDEIHKDLLRQQMKSAYYFGYFAGADNVQFSPDCNLDEDVFRYDFDEYKKTVINKYK